MDDGFTKSVPKSAYTPITPIEIHSNAIDHRFNVEQTNSSRD